MLIRLPRFVVSLLLCLSLVWPAHAQESALKVDKNGSPVTPLNLGAGNYQGQLPASHLPVGSGAGNVAPGDDSRFRWVFTPEMYGAVGDGSHDDTSAMQSAITAASALTPPGAVRATRRYATYSTLTAAAAFVLDGAGTGQIIAQFATGDIIHCAPNHAVDLSNPNSGLRWLTFRDLKITSTVTRTSGAGIFAQYTDTCIIDNVIIGDAQLNPNGTTLPIYDAIFLDKQSNCWIHHPQFYSSHQGLCITGATTAATAWYSFGGWIGGGGFVYGNYATDSIGIHIAGMCGGFELEDFDCGQWGYASLQCDMSLAAGSNHELFIGRVFLDSPGVCGAYVAANSLNILKLHHGWIAGCGRLPGLQFGTGQPPENGVGLYIQKPQSTLRVDVSSGSNIYACETTGIVVEDCIGFTMVGANCYSNGFAGEPNGAGGHGVDIQGGNNVLLAWNDLTTNAGAPFILRKANSTYGFAGCNSYNAQNNDGGGCGIAPVEESVAARTANMYAGDTMGWDDLSKGPASKSAAPAEAGLASSPFAISTSAGSWVNVPGLSLTIPSSGRYRLYALIRYGAQISSGEGFLCGQLLVNGTAVGGPSWVRLIDDLQTPNATVQRTAGGMEWTYTLGANDVVQFQVKRDGNTASWSTCQLLTDSNGATLLGFYQIP